MVCFNAERSPLALRMIKRSLNAELDGQHGLMQLAGDATLLYYLTEEAQEAVSYTHLRAHET